MASVAARDGAASALLEGFRNATMLCLLALIAFAGLAVISTRYRPLAREALACVFRRVTLRKCTTGFDKRVKAAVVGRMMRTHPEAARLLHRHLEALAWTFVLVFAGSGGYLGYGLYNFHRYGSCYGPVRRGFCVFDFSGRRSRYSGIAIPYRGRPVVPGDGGGPALGPPEAPVTVIEFGCYTCPYTRESASAVEEVVARHRNSVRFVYRHFPLDAVESATCEVEPGPHAGATRAAIAAGCARAQERFWEYHRQLLSRPEAVATCDALVRLASELGMDDARFARCLTEPAMENAVHREFDDGVKAGLYGTPTFYVNGERLVAPSDDELEDAVRHALEQVHK
jgi:protein-disulfide isomerase